EVLLREAQRVHDRVEGEGRYPAGEIGDTVLDSRGRLSANSPMTPDDIAPEFRSQPKDYAKPAPIEGVRVLRLKRFTDDRGFFMEIFRAKANHPESRELAEFFAGVPIAQANYSIVDAEGHIKGLHYH